MCFLYFKISWLLFIWWQMVVLFADMPTIAVATGMVCDRIRRARAARKRSCRGQKQPCLARQQIGKNKAIAVYGFPQHGSDGRTEHRAGVGETMELAVLAAGVGCCR